MMKKYLLLFIATLIFPLFAFAQQSFTTQSLIEAGIEEQVSITVSPKTPAPNEPVSIQVESYSSDFNKAYITWSSNGSIIQEGVGLKKITLNAPNSGIERVIKITIKKSEGGTLIKNVTLAPANVDILYEAQTYTPPFFKGKSMYTNESVVTFMALPDFAKSGGLASDAKNLVYTWEIDNQVIADKSGYGRNVFEYKGNLISRPIKVSVTVSPAGSSIKAKKSITLTTTEPFIALYEKNPILGTIFEQNLNSPVSLDRSEVEITAVPFYFSANRSDDNNLIYNWRVNGNDILGRNDQNSVVFRREEGTSGIANISVKVSHVTNLLQSYIKRVEFNLSENKDGLKEFQF